MEFTRDKSFNPFPGLRPFSPEESDLFFGRKKESAEVLEKLFQNRFVTVMGASGTGKSSLIYCGVIPGIRSVPNGSQAEWKVVSFRPGDDPMGNLVKAARELMPENESETMVQKGENGGSVQGILSLLIHSENEKVLLVIDQFEELFRYSSVSEKDNSSAVMFVDSLVRAVSDPSVNVFTIITMRSDFIGECATYQGLTQLINSSNYLVPHMGSENYRQAIEGPVGYAGAIIEPALVDSLLKDIGERTDQLPVLQHAMMRTWTYWQELDEPDRPISRTDYDAIGTMSDAMSMHANEAYEELSPRGKEICEKMFKTITDKGSDNKGLRRPSSVGTIMSIAACTSGELFEVIEKFRTPSRSFITPRHNIPLTEDSIIDVSHESLMRLWNRLREWVDDEASSVQMYMRLSDASSMYQLGNTTLWRPPDLQIAINWRDQHKPTLAWAERYDPAFERAMVYLRTSEQTFLEEEENKIRLQKRQIRRTKIVAGILGTAAIISVGFMLFAFVQQIAAERQRLLAEQQTREAEKQKAAADTARKEADDQRALADSSAILARLNEAEALKQSQLARAEQIRAQQEAVRANTNEQIAITQKDSATRAKELAIKNEQRANQETEKALRLRMLSIGKSMSIKSLQAQDSTLQILLAYQAYLFNKKNGGLNNDADIYAGLYNVSRQMKSPAVRSFKGHNGAINSIAYVPGKNEFFTAGSDGKVLKWTISGKQETMQVIFQGMADTKGTTEIIDVVAVSPDAGWLACASSNTGIRMIPLKTENTEYVLKGHTNKIKSLIFSYDGKYLYSAGLDNKVLKWDLVAHTSTDVSDGKMKVTAIDVSSNGKYIAGISTDRKVIVWDPENTSDNFRLETSGREIKVIRFNPDNQMLAVGDISGNVELWDITTKKMVSTVKAHDSQVNDIRFNSFMKQMATAGNDSRLKIFNISVPSDLTEPPITFSDHEGWVLAMQFSPDGQLIVSGAYKGADNLMSRPSHVDYFVDEMCSSLSRNMTQSEWDTYVAKDIPLEPTCERLYNIKVSAIK